MEGATRNKNWLKHALKFSTMIGEHFEIHMPGIGINYPICKGYFPGFSIDLIFPGIFRNMPFFQVFQVASPDSRFFQGVATLYMIIATFERRSCVLPMVLLRLQFPRYTSMASPLYMHFCGFQQVWVQTLASWHYWDIGGLVVSS